MTFSISWKSLSFVIPTLAVLVLPPAVRAADHEKHCPTPIPPNDHVVCRKGCDPTGDKQILENLARELQQSKDPVCLLAMVDPTDHGYSKKLAIRRVLWVRDTLMENGVMPGVIAVELRPRSPDAARTDLQSVEVIVGR